MTFKPLSLDIAAATIWQEARGQGPIAMAIVAAVILNRSRILYFSDGTLIGTCLRPAQFSGWANADIRLRSLQWVEGAGGVPTPDFVRNLILAVHYGKWAFTQTWTNEALNYYSPQSEVAPPDWATQMTFLGEIPGFRFYRSNP